MIKRLTYRKQRKAPPILPKGGLRRWPRAEEPELFTGQVRGFKASQGEERAANALDRNPRVRNFFFRMTIGAERNMPGWKELDFLIEAASGMWYAVEVDSQFTHRDKQAGDILHDAIVLDSLRSLNVFPEVIHWDIDRDLPNARTAAMTVKQLTG